MVALGVIGLIGLGAPIFLPVRLAPEALAPSDTPVKLPEP